VLLASLFLGGFAHSSAAQETHKRVLILYSFGPNYAPFDAYASGLRKEMARLSPKPVEFFEASLETARFARTNSDDALADYLSALFRDSSIDLVVSIGGPAALFCRAHREHLFPSTPLLTAALERRLLAKAAPSKGAASVTVERDFPALIEHILSLLPDTTDIFVVMGGSSSEKIWVEELRREFQRFADRIRFTWLHELSLEQMRERVSNAPPNTAVFYGLVTVDGTGVPQEHDEALERLHSASTAPIFGLFDSQMGRGIVGGPLIPISEASRQAAETALRLLSGEAPESIRTEPLAVGAPIYDFRELERWSIPESLLPPRSTILFRPPSLWQEYGWPLSIGLGVLFLQTALIGGLLLQRSRRRLAEEEGRALARRLLTAHEDESRRLARELHDDFSQRLARLSIDAAGVDRSLSLSAAKDSVRTMRADLARLSDDVHAVAYQLHPSVLRDLGLNEALKVECEQFSRRESIPARLASFEAPSELPPDVAVCLFRIAQEALRNVARHSRASRVSLAVTTTNGSVRMTVSDDGVGFVPAQARIRSLGHASMRERAHLVGGTLEVESAPGRGTTVHVSVPLKEGSP
jgi:signal transduction histidine kinase